MSIHPNEAREAVKRLKRINSGVELSQEIYQVEIGDGKQAVHAAANRVKRLMLNDEKTIIKAFTDLDDGRVVENLAALVRRLSRYIFVNDSRDNEVAKKAMEYLKRVGLEGSIIRTADDHSTEDDSR